jgi:thioredoxin-like negative regulator of GroEL
MIDEVAAPRDRLRTGPVSRKRRAVYWLDRDIATSYESGCDPVGMMALADTSFNQFVTGHRFVIVHFWASWNRHDDQMRAFLELELPENVRNQIAIGTLDVDPPEHHGLCLSHNVRNLPFLAFYRDGVLFGTLTGMQKQEALHRLNALVNQ